MDRLQQSQRKVYTKNDKPVPRSYELWIGPQIREYGDEINVIDRGLKVWLSLKIVKLYRNIIDDNNNTEKGCEDNNDDENSDEE